MSGHRPSHRRNRRPYGKRRRAADVGQVQVHRALESPVLGGLRGGRERHEDHRRRERGSQQRLGFTGWLGPGCAEHRASSFLLLRAGRASPGPQAASRSHRTERRATPPTLPATPGWFRPGSTTPTPGAPTPTPGATPTPGRPARRRGSHADVACAAGLVDARVHRADPGRAHAARDARPRFADTDAGVHGRGRAGQTHEQRAHRHCTCMLPKFVLHRLLPFELVSPGWRLLHDRPGCCPGRPRGNRTPPQFWYSTPPLVSGLQPAGSALTRCRPAVRLPGVRRRPAAARWPPAAGPLRPVAAPWPAAVARWRPAAAPWPRSRRSRRPTVRAVVRRATPATDTGVSGAPTTAWASRTSVKPAAASGDASARYSSGIAAATSSALRILLRVMVALLGFNAAGSRPSSRRPAA